MDKTTELAEIERLKVLMAHHHPRTIAPSASAPCRGQPLGPNACRPSSMTVADQPSRPPYRRIRRSGSAWRAEGSVRSASLPN